MGQLTEEQIDFYNQNGYVLISGLIDPDIAAKGESKMWSVMGANPADKSTWKSANHVAGYSDPEILACFTQEVLEAAALLSESDPGELEVPASAFVINVFPTEGEWVNHGMHIDHAIPEDDYSVFPRPLRVASITYLNDVEPHSGGTVVWPGSHKKIEALAKSDPVRYEKMWQLNNELHLAEIGEPIELLGNRGDVLFYHYLTAHSGSMNVGSYPRLALVHKW